MPSLTPFGTCWPTWPLNPISPGAMAAGPTPACRIRIPHPPSTFDAVARCMAAWGASLRGLPANSNDSGSADDTYNDFDDPRVRAQLVTRWPHLKCS